MAKIVIGEGERDEAPMLYIGEKVGKGGKIKIDIALDPLEGTTLTAKAMANASGGDGLGPQGDHAEPTPDTYMDKIACGPGFPPGVIDLDKTPAENVKALGQGQGRDAARRSPSACSTGPRHAEIIAALRAVGALDLSGSPTATWPASMNTADPENRRRSPTWALAGRRRACWPARR